MWHKTVMIGLLVSVPVVLALGGGDIWLRLAGANAGEGAPKTLSEKFDVQCQFPAWIGQPVDRQTVQQAAGERPYRIYTQGDPITEDFVPTRLNVILDQKGLVKRVKCG
jgi:hypothetical protein